ncbi:hypothetical protein BGZ95_003528, partial [Linnemannia exigua]
MSPLLAQGIQPCPEVTITSTNVFKRRYLEMLSNKITNGEAWSLIPYVKALTVRHCFCKAGVLSKAQTEKLEQESVDVEELTPFYPSVADMDADQAKRQYVRLIASVMDGDEIQFSLDRNQKDAQDMAEEIKEKLRKNIAKRYGSRDRISSIERDVIGLFKSKEN